MAEKMTVEKAGEFLGRGFHCPACILKHTAERLGMDPQLAIKMSGGLGGGCFAGGTCGAIAGGILSLGLVYGYDENEENIPEQNAELVGKIKELEAKFTEMNGSITCKDLLGKSFAIPEEAQEIMTQGLTKNCPKYCADVCAILDEMLDELK